jgi:hypothetical protein
MRCIEFLLAWRSVYRDRYIWVPQGFGRSIVQERKLPMPDN